MGFGRVNSLLGAAPGANNCQYIWDGNSVVLKDPGFDEEMFRRVKLARLIDKDTCLSISDLRTIVDKVLGENARLLLDISCSSPETSGKLERQLDRLLDQEVVEAENEAQLRISKSNIKQAQPLTDGWMSYQEVDAMMALLHKHKFEAPDRCKFVNRNRH
jgi:hypothetical protein